MSKSDPFAIMYRSIAAIAVAPYTAEMKGGSRTLHHTSENVQPIVVYVMERAEREFRAGDMEKAIEDAYLAGVLQVTHHIVESAKFGQAMAEKIQEAIRDAPKILNAKRGRPKNTTRYRFEQRWKATFQRVASFRSMDAAAQSGYLIEHHPEFRDSVKGTLDKYARDC